MKITYNQMFLFAIICAVGWSFTLGMGYSSLFSLQAENKKKSGQILHLKSENENLKIEVNGLMRLMKIKDNQFIGHYTHTEIKSDFRIVNKR